MTLIGTTDEQVEKPEDAVISPGEIDYLCAAVNLYFKRQIGPDDVRATYSGVRPLYDDGASEAKAVTRDYVLELDTGGPPLLSVFGGKITTSRHLAEEAMAKLSPALAPTLGRNIRPVTGNAPLPGGDLNCSFTEFLARVRSRWPFLGAQRSERMARAYGSQLLMMLDRVTSEADLGTAFGGGLTQVELDYLITHEWAKTADDVLMRRTKIGLAVGPEVGKAITAYLDAARESEPLFHSSVQPVPS